MTGPRTSTVHPLPRRPWLLLPFLATVAFLPLGCSDQPTEPITTTTPVAAVVRHPVKKPAPSQLAASRSSAQLAVSCSQPQPQPGAGTGPRVLILADTMVESTNALASSLSNAGLQVTLRCQDEYTFDGTNPSLDNFDAVIHLDGSTYDSAMTDAGQNALASFVSNGGGFIGAQWNGFEYQPQMADLVLQSSSGAPCGFCDITYKPTAAGAGHPVLAGLPDSLSFTADGHDGGPQIDFTTNPSTVLMEGPGSAPAVLVREFGAGKVVNFSFAPNYYWDDLGGNPEPVMLQNPAIQQLYLNAVRWVSGAGAGKIAQNISFAPLGNKVYGDPAFALGATASSGLPVNYIASGNCQVQGSTATLTGAGSCTITAQQAGNDQYEAAADVSRSFFIAKGPATIILSGLSQAFDGTVKSAVATTAPAGLSLVTVKYSQGGVEVGGPTAQGSYQVVATLDNPNYQAPAATGTLTIGKAVPTIQWQPGRISVGTPLGAAQLNAVASGLGGVSLSGQFVYNPAEGTRLKAGIQTLTVQFTPADQNYAGASKSVTIMVEQGFKGFHPPVKNMPLTNVVTAGSTVPMKFSLAEYSGLQVLSGAPTSIPVQCGSGPEAAVSTITPVSRDAMSAVGSTYTYSWRTNTAWAGSCRKFIMTLADGTTHEAMFRFAAKSNVNSAARRILRSR